MLGAAGNAKNGSVSGQHSHSYKGVVVFNPKVHDKDPPHGAAVPYIRNSRKTFFVEVVVCSPSRRSTQLSVNKFYVQQSSRNLTNRNP